MNEVTISDIELQDLQAAVTVMADDDTIIVATDPIGAAESVCRSLIDKIHEGKALAIPDCHSLADDPMGFESDATECLACFDKMTCMVSLHRMNRNRLNLRINGELIEPVSRETAGIRVPIDGVLVRYDGLMRLSKPRLIERAEGMGASVHKGMANEQLVRIIRRAKGDKHGVIDVEIEESKKGKSKKIVNIGAPAKIDIEKVLKKAKIKPIKRYSKEKGSRVDWVARSGFVPGDILEPNFQKYIMTGAILKVMEKDFILVVGDFEGKCKNLRRAMNALVHHMDPEKKIPSYSGKTFWRLKES